MSLAFRAWGSRADVTRPLRDGEPLALRDRTLHVHHRPGHSPTDTVFHDRERRMLIGADHLLGAHLLQPPDHAAARRLRRAPAGARAVPRLARRNPRDGPGPRAAGPRRSRSPTTATLIDERFALHRRRADKIHGLIAERPRSAYEIAQALWGNIAVTQAYLTLSEVLGHLDLLEDEGRVREVARDGVSVFEAT